MFHPQGPTFWELARQCLSSTERGYDLLAPKFDYTPFRTPHEVLAGLAEVVGREIPIDDALDVCCGTGAAIGMLRSLCRRRIVGIDFSPGMLAIAREQFPLSLVDPAAELIRGDVLDMHFDREFDLAVTVGSLGHILPKDEPRFIERIHAALRPGGRFAFVTAEMPPWWSRRAIASRAFNAAMIVRNTFWRPPFIMYYLTFLLPRARQLLEAAGFNVAVRGDAFTGRLKPLVVVVATKRD